MIIAAKHGHKDVIEVLLEHNADLHRKNAQGQSALDVARRPEVLQALKNADIAFIRRTTQLEGITLESKSSDSASGAGAGEGDAGGVSSKNDGTVMI